jgi:hypothetical protein
MWRNSYPSLRFACKPCNAHLYLFLDNKCATHSVMTPKAGHFLDEVRLARITLNGAIEGELPGSIGYEAVC